MAYKSSARGSRPVRLVAVHTTEGAMTAASLGSYFYQDSTQASSHSGSDDKGVKNYVPFDRAAWTIRSGNAISDNLEICGFAHWTRADWLGPQYKRLVIAAQWVRARCLARGIPRRWLTPAQVAAGMSGIIGHVDWTLGMHDGTHTDPGGGFPKDVFMALVAKDEEDEDEMALDFGYSNPEQDVRTDSRDGTTKARDMHWFLTFGYDVLVNTQKRVQEALDAAKEAEARTEKLETKLDAANAALSQLLQRSQQS